MKKYKYKRRIRKIKKFGKKVGIALIFLIVSYLLSLLSFYLYTQLSQILQPDEKGFFGFLIIGLIAGLIAALVSLVNKRLLLTVVISFFIDCLVDSVILYSALGTQVVQFLPGLLIGMFVIVGSGYFLKRKLGLFDKNILSLHNLKEKDYKNYALARKLLENPNKITMEVFKEACKLLQGIDPRIDAVLKEVNNFSRALSGDVLGFIVAHIKAEKEKDEEKKEKVLFFIDLINDIKEEIDFAFVKLGASEAKNYVDHPIKQANHSILANATTTVSSPSLVATIVASSVIVTSAVGIIPGISLLPKDEFQIPKTQNSQDMNTPGITGIVVPSVTPTATPTNTPTVPPTLAITVSNGWGHFTRIFSGPADPAPVIDYTTIAMYVTVHNNGATEDRIIGGASSACNSITFDDMSIFGPDGTVSGIDIPAKSTVIMDFMKAGRIICNGAKEGLKQGDRFTVSLIFEKFGKVPVWIEIRATPE